MRIDRRILRSFDWALFCSILLIPSLGLVVLYSAGYDPEETQSVFSWLPWGSHSPAFARQLFFVVCGLAAMLLGALIPYTFFQRYAYLFYAGCIILLGLVLIVGVEAKGAHRWLSLAGFTFQPSEMMKFGVILALARYLSKTPPPPGGYDFLSVVPPCLIFLLPMGLVMAQPDLGTALAIGGVGFCMVLFVGIRWRVLATFSVVLPLVAFSAWHWVLRPYQKMRVLVLFNPEADSLGSGYHIIQSMIAVGSGNFFGKGFMQGTQTRLEFLPEHTTDFIFSVLAEEWGFAGCLLVICAFICLIYFMIRVVLRSRELYAAFLAFGVSSQIFLNALINIGMVVGLLPVVGIPLPLFSYGGTSMISTMFALGIVMGVHMRRMIFAGNQ